MENIVDILQKERSIKVGTFTKEMFDTVTGKIPHLSEKLKPDTEIYLLSGRIKHLRDHEKDFVDSEEFNRCLNSIPDIIENPDYITVSPKNNSISFIKVLYQNVNVAVRVSERGTLTIRTMYPITTAQLQHYVSQGLAWKWDI